MASLTNNGIDKFDHYRREILQTYGYEVLFTLNHLERVGLLKRQDGKGNFSSLKKSMQLFVDEVDEANPKDISYVYSGFSFDT